jgi:hypothetical protein
LEKHWEIVSSDPHSFELMISIATWEGWPDAMARSFIEHSVEKEPEFWQTYFAAADYYSPYWNGDADKLERFANWAANRAQGAQGDALYTRIYWWNSDRYFNKQFFGSKIDCSRMMRGVDRLINTNPDPWNINHFALFAVSCGDKERAKSLFTRIGDNPDLVAWGSSNTFVRFKSWAMEK